MCPLNIRKTGRSRLRSMNVGSFVFENATTMVIEVEVFGETHPQTGFSRLLAWVRELLYTAPSAPRNIIARS